MGGGVIEFGKPVADCESRAFLFFRNLFDFASFFNEYSKMADVNNGVIVDHANDGCFSDFHADYGSENYDLG